MTTKKKKAPRRYQFTPDSIRSELTDRIEQGWSNDRIVEAYEDTGPNLRRWLNGERARIRRFWRSMGGDGYDSSY